MAEPATPVTADKVWDMIRRADDVVKYAPNRDPAIARRQARDILEKAARAAAALDDEKARKALEAQARKRLEDLQAS